MPHAAFDAARVGEFGGLAEAAELCVEGSVQSCARFAQRKIVKCDIAGRRFGHEFCECKPQLLVLRADLCTVFLVVLGRAPQQFVFLWRKHGLATLRSYDFRLLPTTTQTMVASSSPEPRPTPAE